MLPTANIVRSHMYTISMADLAPIRPQRENLPVKPRSDGKLTPVQALAAQLMGSGMTVSQVAERLVDYIIQKQPKLSRKDRLKRARTRVRSWSKRQKFRDAMYDTAVVALDLKSPAILQGLAKKAMAGRVDAAKMALAITGRYAEKGEVQATHVEVVFSGVPRPTRIYDVDGEAEEEEAEAE